MIMNHDYETQKAQQSVQVAAAQLDQKNREAWVKDILPRYDIKDLEANYNMCLSYCNGELTLGKFEFLIQNTPPGFTLIFGDERQDLLDKIKERLTDPYGRRMSAFDLESQMKKFGHLDRMQLRAKLDEITRRQELNKKTAAELRADNAAYHKAQTNGLYPGYETLPETIIPPGQTQGVSTKEYLQHLAKHNFRGFEYFVKRYGSAQVDDIRLGRRG
jgi:hypothetical protein